MCTVFRTTVLKADDTDREPRMKLTMLAVEASDGAVVPPEIPFRWLAHHVREVLLALLSKGLDVDGSGKIQVTCGPKGEDVQYQQMLGTSNYFVEDFDFAQFSALTGESRDNYLLDIIQNSLIDMALRSGASPTVERAIKETADVVRAHDFSLKLRIPKLCKSSPSRRAKAEVFRCLNRVDGEAWCLQVTTKGVAEPSTTWLTERPHYVDMTGYFKKAEWSGERYLLRNRLGKVVHEYTLGLE